MLIHITANIAQSVWFDNQAMHQYALAGNAAALMLTTDLCLLLHWNKTIQKKASWTVQKQGADSSRHLARSSFFKKVLKNSGGHLTHLSLIRVLVHFLMLV